MGDIGQPRKVIIAEPLPEEAPAELPVPAPAPVPGREAVPA
jgi:hypothetical protein